MELRSLGKKRLARYVLSSIWLNALKTSNNFRNSVCRVEAEIKQDKVEEDRRKVCVVLCCILIIFRVLGPERKKWANFFLISLKQSNEARRQSRDLNRDRERVKSLLKRIEDEGSSFLPDDLQLAKVIETFIKSMDEMFRDKKLTLGCFAGWECGNFVLEYPGQGHGSSRR